MQPKLRLLTLLLFLFFQIQAQHWRQDNGYLIYASGKDTTLIGRYELKGDEFSTTVVVIRDLNVHKLKGKFFSNGELQYVEGYNYKPIAGKDSQMLQTYKLYHSGDTTYTEHKRGDSVTVRKYPFRGMLGGGLGPYIFMPVLLASYTPAKVGDSLISTQLGLNNPFVLKRISKRKVTASTQIMGTFTVHLNEEGRVAYIDAMGTSYNIRGTIVSNLNLDSLILVNAKREQESGPLGSLNKADSVQATIGSTSIKINYTRPSMRGRVIFGEVVPWNRYWRTGADAATRLTLSSPIYFNGKELSAGIYSVFTMPSKDSWTMMFNKEATIWGTNYNPAHDVLRVPMQVEVLKEPVELMTIEVVRTAKGGAINVIWEKTKASAHFSINSIQNTDSLEINSLINEFYQTLSFEKVEVNKFDRLFKFFTPEALMIGNVGTTPEFSTVKQFVDGAKESWKKFQVTARNEYELCAKTEIFGKIAHRFSTYKIQIIAKGRERYTSGINTIQLIKQNNRWVITNIAWDGESQTKKIPAKYLCE